MARLATISDLPDELLARVLRALAAPDPEADPSSSHDIQELLAAGFIRSGRGVCKRWRAAIYSDPVIWQSLTLRADRLQGLPIQRQVRFLEANFNLLRRVGQHVRAFTAYDCGRLAVVPGAVAGGWQLTDFLQLLRPSSLRALTIHSATSPDVIPDAAIEAVGRFQGLTALHLGSSSGAGLHWLPACTAGVLRRLPSLASLRLFNTSHQAQSLVESIGSLHSLVHLEVVVGHRVYSGQLPFDGLTQLRHLHLFNARLGQQGLASFPLLASYVVGSLKFGDSRWIGDAEYRDGVLRLDNSLVNIWRYFLRPLRPGIIAGLLPPTLPAVTRLELLSCSLTASLPRCTQLSSLMSLTLCDCFTRSDGSGGSDSSDDEESSDEEVEEMPVAEEALQALLQQALGLAELSISDSLGGAAPACIDGLTALTKLSLRSNGLSNLHAGAYLTGLAVLDLRANSFMRLPPHTHTACGTALTRLVLDDNEDLVLSMEDAHELLPALPRLAELQLGAESLAAPRVRQALLASHPNPALELAFTWGDTQSEGTSSGDLSDDEEE